MAKLRTLACTSSSERRLGAERSSLPFRKSMALPSPAAAAAAAAPRGASLKAKPTCTHSSKGTAPGSLERRLQPSAPAVPSRHSSTSARSLEAQLFTCSV